MTILGWRFCSARLEIKLADFWIGAFWRTGRLVVGESPLSGVQAQSLDIWLCLLPCVPLHLTLWRPRPSDWDEIQEALA